MNIVKLDATNSTNQYLKALIQSQTLEDYTVVMANEQQNGKGQLGNIWISQPGMNLTVSILKKNHGLLASNQFLLNVITSLAVYNVLKEFNISDLSIKWPNDILSGSSKICGILIENIISGATIKSSIIGIGLNVNQTSFENLPKATSLKLELGRSISLEKLLKSIVKEFKSSFLEDICKTEQQFWKAYEAGLFRKDKVSTFKSAQGEEFNGIIRNVLPNGELKIELEEENYKSFAFKEVQLCY